MIPTKAWTPVRERDGIGPTGVRFDYVNDNVRFRVASAGRRSTKTLHAKRRIVEALTDHYLPEFIANPPDWATETQRFFYGAPTQDQAKRIAWKDLKDLVPPHWVKEISDSELRITTKFNSELWVIGLDKARRIEGTAWNGCILDEFPDMRAEAWGENIIPALADRQGWAWILGVPDVRGTNNQLFKELFDRGNSGDPNWKSYTWTSEDILPAEEIEIQKANNSPQTYRQEFLASWETMPGRAYSEFVRAEHVDHSVQFTPGPILVSCDFNRGHHNWGLYQHHAPDVYHAFDEIYLQNATVEMMCGALQERVAKLNGASELIFFGDYSGEQKRAEATSSAWQQVRNHFKNYGLKSTYRYAPSPPIADRVNKANGYLRNAKGEIRTKVSPRCFNLIRDLEGVTMALLYSNAKSEELSHASDNYGYLLIQHSSQRRSSDLAKQIAQSF